MGTGVGTGRVLLLEDHLSDRRHCQVEDAVLAGARFCPESPCPTVIKGNHVSGWSNVALTHADSPKGFCNKRLQCTESLGVGRGGRFLFLKFAGLNV